MLEWEAAQHLIPFLLRNVEFTEREKKGGATGFMQLSEYPEDMTKKMTLLKYFRDYMKDNLQDVSEGGRG